jgi:hypothetical protein
LRFDRFAALLSLTVLGALALIWWTGHQRRAHQATLVVRNEMPPSEWLELD